MSVSRMMTDKVPRLLLPISPSSSSTSINNNNNTNSTTTDTEKKKRNVNSLYDNLYSPRTEITDAISSRLSDGGDVNSPSRTFFRDSQDLSSLDKINHIPRTSSLIEFIHRTGSIDEYQHGFLDSPMGSPRGPASPRNVMSRSSRAQNCPHLAAPSPTPVVFPVQIHGSLYGSSSGLGTRTSFGSNMIDASQLEISLQKASLSLLQTSMDELDMVDDDEEEESSIPAWDQWNDVDDKREYRRELYSSSPRLSFEEHPSDSSGDESMVLSIGGTRYSSGYK